jgi:hypothetical protein
MFVCFQASTNQTSITNPPTHPRTSKSRIQPRSFPTHNHPSPKYACSSNVTNIPIRIPSYRPSRTLLTPDDTFHRPSHHCQNHMSKPKCYFRTRQRNSTSPWPNHNASQSHRPCDHNPFTHAPPADPSPKLRGGPPAQF